MTLHVSVRSAAAPEIASPVTSPHSADAFQVVLRQLNFDLVPDLTRQSLQAPRLVSVRDIRALVLGLIRDASLPVRT